MTSDATNPYLILISPASPQVVPQLLARVQYSSPVSVAPQPRILTEWWPASRPRPAPLS